MSALRKLQRQVIMNRCYKRDGHKRTFNYEWEKVHYEDTEENLTQTKRKNASSKKRNYIDDGKTYVRKLNAAKTFMENVKNKTQSKENARTKVC